MLKVGKLRYKKYVAFNMGISSEIAVNCSLYKKNDAATLARKYSHAG